MNFHYLLPIKIGLAFKKSAIFIGLVLALALMLFPQKASAQFGVPRERGYFTGGAHGGGRVGLFTAYGGLPQTNASSFITDVVNHLNSGVPQRSTSASFIIHTMLGHDGPRGGDRSVSGADLAEWQNRINYWDGQGRIDWTASRVVGCDELNTAYGPPPFNDVTPTDIDPSSCGGPTLGVIRFFNASWNLVYEIKDSCGNPLGDLPGLEDDPSVGSARLTVSTSGLPGGLGVGFTSHHHTAGDCGSSFTVTGSRNCSSASPNGVGWHDHGGGARGGIEIEAPASVSSGGITYDFTGWSGGSWGDGGQHCRGGPRRWCVNIAPGASGTVNTGSITANFRRRDRPPTLSSVNANCTQVTGNASDPDGPVTIRLFKDGALINTISANGNFTINIASHGDLFSHNYMVQMTGNVPPASTPASNNVQSQTRNVARCRDAQCVSAVPDPSIVEPGQNFHVRATFRIVNASTSTASPIGSNGRTSNYRYRIGADPGYPLASAPWVNGSIGAGGQFTTFSRGPLTRATTSALNTSAVIEFTSPAMAVPPCNSPGDEGEVADKPYFEARRGDVSTGLNSSCAGWSTGPMSGNLTAWNQFASGGDFNRGAGVDLAVYARNVINEFASGQNSGGPGIPKRLTFANTSGTFGGGLTDSVRCPKDYYGTLPPSGTTSLGPTASVANNNTIYSRTGPLTLSGGGVSGGNRTAIYVEGNVYINGNITLSHGGTPQDISSFWLVVRGNIYIAPGVSRLDGVYVAQPNGSNDGRIYTCALGTAAPNNVQIRDNCRSTQLQVNGAFIARQLKLYRSKGTMSGGPSCAPFPVTDCYGERFSFTPAIWLAVPAPIGVTSVNGGYDAITSLPPVL